MSKRGLAGYSGSCNGVAKFWGVSVNCPNPERAEHSDAMSNDPGPGVFIEDPANRNKLTSRGFAFNARDWTNVFVVVAHKDIIPDVWPRDASPYRVWYAFAAKLPASYPFGDCEKYPPVSSAVDGGDGTWQGGLGSILEIDEWSLPGDTDEPKVYGLPKGFGYVLRSRAIYVDGAQHKVAYSTLGNYPYSTSGNDVNGNPFADQFILPNPPRPLGRMFGDTYVFSIANPESYRQDGLEPWYTSTLGGNVNMGLAGSPDPTLMEAHFDALRTLIENVLVPVFGDSEENRQWPANAIYLGDKFAGLSAYNPTARYGWDNPWAFGRLEYDDQRPLTGGSLVPGIDCFCTYAGSPAADLGDPDTEYAGDYIVALFSVRCHKDSSVVSEENPDEPHAIAIHKDTFSETPVTKILATNGLPFTSKIYRPGVGDEGGVNGYGLGTAIADGTLSEDEVAAGQMIMDSENPPEGYEDEVFTNPRIWHFGRVWDAVENKCVNQVLLTTQPDDAEGSADDVVADFEEGDGTDQYYLDSGLDTHGLHFTTGPHASSGDKFWSTDGAESHGGSLAARSTENDVTLEGNADLSITIHVVGDDDMKVDFWYQLDNRSYGTHLPPFETLTNNAEPDNYLAVYDNGAIVPINIDGTDYSVEDGGSKIDNVNVPSGNTFADPAFYTTWKHAAITLTPGTHLLRWSFHREWQDNGHSVAWLDDISFPNIMLGDDIDGVTRWWSVDGVLRKLTDWQFAVRDDEGDEVITSRSKTNPYSMDMDGAGRTLIMGPQYVIRMNRDGTLDKTHGRYKALGDTEPGTGYVRFHASPDNPAPPVSCLDPDDDHSIDSASDAPWGAVQVLATGEDTYQVIGANGDLYRDTTHWPFDKNQWTYKHPISGKLNREIFTSGATGTWADRVHRWVIRDNGKTLEPCIEMIWRPTLHQPAHPGEGGTTDAERFPHTPYRSDFATSTVLTDWNPQSIRWRDPMKIPADYDALLTTEMFNVYGVYPDFNFNTPAGEETDGYYTGMHARIAGKVYPIIGYLHDYPPGTDGNFWQIANDDPDGFIFGFEEGATVEILDYHEIPPRWTPNNYIIARTGSDALSRIPQAFWVRTTSDGPSSGDSAWDPDTDAATIDASTADPKPWGGPMASACWALMQGRFICAGSAIVFYVYSNDLVTGCVGHGPDEDDEGAEPQNLLSYIQRPHLPRAAMTDFDVVKCDCGCC